MGDDGHGLCAVYGTCMLLMVRAGMATVTRTWDTQWTEVLSRIPCFRAKNPSPMIRKRIRIAVKTLRKSMLVQPGRSP